MFFYSADAAKKTQFQNGLNKTNVFMALYQELSLLNPSSDVFLLLTGRLLHVLSCFSAVSFCKYTFKKKKSNDSVIEVTDKCRDTLLTIL